MQCKVSPAEKIVVIIHCKCKAYIIYIYTFNIKVFNSIHVDTYIEYSLYANRTINMFSILTSPLLSVTLFQWLDKTMISGHRPLLFLL